MVQSTRPLILIHPVVQKHHRYDKNFKLLRLPDGAIVEVLNTDLPLPGLHEDVKRILRTENDRIKSARGRTSPRAQHGEA